MPPFPNARGVRRGGPARMPPYRGAHRGRLEFGQLAGQMHDADDCWPSHLLLLTSASRLASALQDRGHWSGTEKLTKLRAERITSPSPDAPPPQSKPPH